MGNKDTNHFLHLWFQMRCRLHSV